MASSRASARKRLQLRHVGLGLPGEAHDEVGTHASLRAGPPDLLQQRAEALAVAEPPHGPQHAAAGVLEGQVEVRRHAGGGRHDLDQPRPQLGGLQVADPDPLDPRRPPRARGSTVLQQPQVAQILAVGGGVLADQQAARARPALGQPACLGHQVLRRPGHERAAERRDRAEAAPAVAARCDLERRHDAAVQPAAQHPRPRGRGYRRAGDRAGPSRAAGPAAVCRARGCGRPRPACRAARPARPAAGACGRGARARPTARRPAPRRAARRCRRNRQSSRTWASGSASARPEP